MRKFFSSTHFFLLLVLARLFRPLISHNSAEDPACLYGYLFGSLTFWALEILDA